MTTSSLFAHTHGLTGYEPNLTNSENTVAWAESRNLCGAQVGWGSISSIPHWGSTRNFTEEANAHNCRNLLAAETLGTFNNQASTGQLKNMRAARDEVHVTVSQATEMSVAAMRDRISTVENQAEQTWASSHQVIL